jgi:prefoldin subunit 2
MQLQGVIQQLESKYDQLGLQSAEQERVIGTLSKVPEDRKCFRLIGGVLVERTVAETLPAVKENHVQLLDYLKKHTTEMEAKKKRFSELRVRWLVMTTSDGYCARNGKGDTQGSAWMCFDRCACTFAGACFSSSAAREAFGRCVRARGSCLELSRRLKAVLSATGVFVFARPNWYCALVESGRSTNSSYGSASQSLMGDVSACATTDVHTDGPRFHPARAAAGCAGRQGRGSRWWWWWWRRWW